MGTGELLGKLDETLEGRGSSNTPSRLMLRKPG